MSNNELSGLGQYAHTPRDLGYARDMRNTLQSFALITLIIAFILTSYLLYTDFSKLVLINLIVIAIATGSLFLSRRVHVRNVRPHREKNTEMNRKLAKQA